MDKGDANMYLMNLSEKVKKAFLELAYLVAVSDNDYSDDEKLIMEAYKKELQIEYDLNDLEGNIDPDAVVQVLCADANEAEKKIIVFEITGLAMTDNQYDDEERKMIKQMNAAFKLDDDYPPKCEALINKYIELQSQIDAFVTEN